MQEPTIEDKIKTLADAGEVEGFRAQLERDGRMTPRIQNLLEWHRVEVLKARAK